MLYARTVRNAPRRKVNSLSTRLLHLIHGKASIMNLVKITPKTKRAKQRVKSHGEIMILIKVKPDSFLVESLSKTYRNTTWAGWFTNNEADYILVTESVTTVKKLHGDDSNGS